MKSQQTLFSYQNLLPTLLSLLLISYQALGQDVCSSADSASVGTNSLPVTGSTEYWYSFTMPSEGKLQIFSSSTEYVRVYTGDCDYRTWHGTGYQNLTVTSLSNGDEVYIKWNTYGGGNFDWQLSVSPLEPGENCDNAVAAIDSSPNSLPATTVQEYWYTYTMPSEGKLRLTSTSGENVAVYTGDCSSLLWEDSGYENTTITSLSLGDDVFIKWDTDNGGNFDWELSVLPLEPGDNCDLAVSAADSINSIPATISQEYWYTYTMPSDGKLQITSTANEFVYVYTGTCNSLYWNGDDYENITVTNLTAGDDIFIRWNTNGGGSFDWVLSVVPFEAGDICDEAVVALDSLNSLPATASPEFWYSYTMPSEGKLQITSNSSETVNVYSGTCTNLSYQGDGYENVTIPDLSMGEEIFIRWNTDYSGGAFDWVLSVVPLQPGDNCDLAVAAVDSLNSLPATLNSEYWYSYTMPSEGKLQLLSSESEYVYVYSGTCDNLSWEGDGYGSATIASLSAGDAIFIKWNTNYSGGDFDWTLNVLPFEPGDNCGLAVAAVDSTNALPATTGDEYWYSYTMPSEGKLNVSTSASEYVYIYTGTCDNLYMQESGYRQATVTTLDAGEDIFIKWRTNSGGNFDWELDVAPFELGDLCELPMAAIDSTNSLPANASDRFWYTYTMPSEGKLQILSSSNENVYVYTGNCDNRYWRGDGYENLTVTSLSAGEEVMIRWNTYNGGDFDWELSVEPFESGDICDLAVAAIDSLNSLPATFGPEYWYSYTMPSEGKLQLLSSSNESVYVYSGTCNSRRQEGSGYENATITSLSMGDEVFIKWNTNYSGGDFDWELRVLPLEQGDNCDLAIAAVDSVNSIPSTLNSTYWYSYTMPSEGKLQMLSSSGEYVSVYSGTCDNLDFLKNGYENLTVTSLTAGDEVFISWETDNGGNFDWDLDVLPFVPGDKCDLAVAAADSINSVPATLGSEYWYSYTMPSDGKLKITSSASEYVYVYKGACNDLDRQEYGYRDVTVKSLSAGDEIYISWRTRYGGDFDWQMSIVPFEPGDNCGYAVAATEGVNSIPATSENEYWYSYTMPSEGKLQLTSTAGEYVYVYTGSCENIDLEDSDYENISIKTLSTGDEVFIRWRTYYGGQFDWELNVVPFEPGDFCKLPAPAEEGTNSLPMTADTEYWYSYTMPSDSKLQIQSTSSQLVTVYSGNCNNLRSEGSGHENATITTLSEGDEIFIKWRTYNGGDFDWDLNIVPLEPGDNCELAVAAVDSTNSVPATTGPYWYTYTMPSEGKLQLVSSSNEYISVYKGSCQDLEWEGSGSGNATITSLSEGDIIFIKWNIDDGGDFDWELNVLPLEPGDKCSLAVAASEGTNNLPATTVSEYWYSFTMPSQSKLHLYSAANEYVAVYTGDCDDLDWKDSRRGDLTITDLSAGEEILIRWDPDNGGDFEWELNILPLEAGDNCDLAAAATDGTNQVPATINSKYWYSYTMPSEGKLQISSDASQYVEISVGNCGFLTRVGEGYENTASSPLSAGEEVYIRWNLYGGGSFNWELNVVAVEPGDMCEMAVAATSGKNSVSTLGSEYWYSYTMPSEGKLQITSNSNNYVYVRSGWCPNLRWEGSGYENATLTDLTPGQEVYIWWETRHNGNFDWDLTVVPLEQGDICDLAVPAAEGVNHVPETFDAEFWYSFTMPSDSKLHLQNSANHSVAIYSGTCRNLEWEGSGVENATATEISAGDEVFIRWDINYRGGDFDWELNLLPLEPGDHCNLTVSANEGANSMPPTINSYYWYSFVMPAEGKIEITSESTQYVNIARGQCGDFHNIADGHGTAAATDVAVGELVYIVWHSDRGGDFDWELNITPLESGDNCQLAVSATLGTNVVPETINSEYWYSYTMPSDGKLQITTDYWSSVYVYTGQCGYTDQSWFGYRNLNVTTLSAGDEVLIKWNIYNNGDFEWDLSVLPVEEGDDCSSAATAIIGTNTRPETIDDYWYTFTMPSDGKLKINSRSSDNVSLYSGGCDVLTHETSGDIDITLTSLESGDVIEGVSYTPLAEGDEILIKWSDSNRGGFTWDLSVVSAEEGDLCATAESAVIGTNSVYVTDLGIESYWYTYTMPSEGKLVVTANNLNGLSAYVGSCDDLRYKGQGKRRVEVANLSVGDVVFLEWRLYRDGIFDWDLAIEPLVAGDGCSTAVQAVEGVNTVPDENSNQYWYHFTMPRDGKLKIKADAEKGVRVFANSCEYSNQVGFWIDSVTVKSLSAGDEVYILWYPVWDEYEISTFDWSLAISDLEPGDYCSVAVAANDGSNYTPKPDYWFSYEVPATGSYTITSLGAPGTNPYLDVFSDCGETVIGVDDDSGIGDQAELTLSLTEGETIYIWWTSYNNDESFNWSIVKEGVELIPQTITFNALPEKTFGDAPMELSATASSGLEVNYEVVQGPVSISANTLTITGAGHATILAHQSGDDTYQAATSVQQYMTIHKAVQQLNLEPISDKSVDDPAFSVVATAASGLSPIYAVSGPASISGSTITLDGSVGTVTVTASQAGNENYLSAVDSTSFEVTTKMSQIITFEAVPDKSYGDAPFDLSAATSSGLPVLFEVVSGPVTLSGNTLTINGAGSVIVNALQAGDATYNSAVAQQTFSILKLDQQITLESISDKVITDDPFDVVATSTSGLALSYTINGPATISGATITLSGTAGEVVLTVSQAGDDNYNAAVSVLDTFYVAEKSAQSITFDAIEDQVLEAKSLALTATSSAGLDVSYTVIDGPATVSGNTLTFTGLGTVIVEASQEGDSQYFAADPVRQSFEISTVTGIEDEVILKISMYPNPVESYLMLEAKDAVISKIELHDLDGRWVRNYHKDIRALDFTGLKEGVYLLKVTSAERIEILRVVKR